MNANCDRDLEYLLLLIIINGECERSATFPIQKLFHTLALIQANVFLQMFFYLEMLELRWYVQRVCIHLMLCIVFKCAIDRNSVAYSNFCWTNPCIMYTLCALLLYKCQHWNYFKLQVNCILFPYSSCTHYFEQRISNSIKLQNKVHVLRHFISLNVISYFSILCEFDVEWKEIMAIKTFFISMSRVASDEAAPHFNAKSFRNVCDWLQIRMHKHMYIVYIYICYCLYMCSVYSGLGFVCGAYV